MTSRPERPWTPGAVTGAGSLPGTDAGEAAALVLGELPDLPHLPELPARGPGAEMIGRSAAMLAELPAEIVPTGWRLTARPGRDLHRARDFLARDLDALEEHAAGYTGPLKVQAAGPWTLAASLELPTGHKVLADHGAVRDLVASLAEGLAAHVADVAARVPGAQPVLQLDEPSVPAVLTARIPTASGYGTLRAVEAAVVEQGLRDVLAAGSAGARVVHCCAPDVPVALLRAAGADAVSMDAAFVRPAGYEALGEAVDDGVSLWLGAVPATGAEVSFDSARTAVRTLWKDLGFAADRLAHDLVPTPSCGLVGASPDRVRRVLAVLRDVGRSLFDE